MVYEVWLLHKDVLRRGHLFCNFFQVFTRQEKLCCGWRNIYTRVRKKSQYFTAGTEWISPPRAVYLMTRTGVCSECVCVRVCVLRVHGCVKEKIRRHPSPSGFYINCGGITLSIVGSLGISSVCNISLIHTSLWTSPCRTIPSVPPPTHRWPCNILRPSF